MGRVRISTTVDRERLERGRQLVGGSDSQLLDNALDALIEVHEQAALRAHPYNDAPDLVMSTFDRSGPPYDGEVPEDVLRLADERRARS